SRPAPARQPAFGRLALRAAGQRAKWRTETLGLCACQKARAKDRTIMRDPYDVLGVGKSASAAEIKSAFRRLAKKYHPDQSKEPRAKERFAEIGAAYEILGDEKRRGAFDRGEIDAEGKPRAPQFEGFGFGRPGGGADFRNFDVNFGLGRGGFSANNGSIDHDILSELFGSGRTRGRTRPQPARGEDIAVVVAIPLAIAANG